MNILHVIPGKDDPVCGIAVAALAIARRQQRAGDQVVCVDGGKWTCAQIRAADEVWVHSMWSPPVLTACLYASLRRVFAHRAARLVRMPHGCLDPVKLAHHGGRKRLVAPLERFLLRRAQRIVSTAAAETDWIRAFAGTQAPVEFLSLDETASWPAVRVRRPARNLLYVGRLHPLKGLVYLLRALPADRRLVVIGRDDGEESKLQALAAERHLDVEFRGTVSAEEKARAFAAADVLVLPTLSENYGLVVQEALREGLPVITTDGAPVWKGQPGVTYLEGYRDGTDAQRVELLAWAIEGRLDSESAPRP